MGRAFARGTTRIRNLHSALSSSMAWDESPCLIKAFAGYSNAEIRFAAFLRTLSAGDAHSLKEALQTTYTSS